MKLTADQVWDHLNRMQHAVMAPESYVDRETFEGEPIEERRDFYNWMCKQCGPFTVGPCWEED